MPAGVGLIIGARTMLVHDLPASRLSGGFSLLALVEHRKSQLKAGLRPRLAAPQLEAKRVPRFPHTF
jgi:hypothetical protein